MKNQKKYDVIIFERLRAVSLRQMTNAGIPSCVIYSKNESGLKKGTVWLLEKILLSLRSH